MGFDDSLIHVLREPKIIAIDNEASQKIASLMRRNFLGFA
jgi:hypothetical protein